MELADMKSLWDVYEKKLEQAVKLNQQFINLIEAEKVKSGLAPLFWRRMAEGVFQAGYMGFLLVFLSKHFSQPPYAVSAILLIGFFATALLNGVRQMIVITRMDYSSNIVTIQSGLAMLQAHNLQYARQVILYIPVFLAFPTVIFRAMNDWHVAAFAHIDMLAMTGGSWWTAQVAAMLCLLPVGMWYYSKLSYKNIHKPWVRSFIERSSGRRVRKAVEFMQELHALQFGVI
jgi:hypothetical protein